jgi:hypothetical protein
MEEPPSFRAAFLLARHDSDQQAFRAPKFSTRSWKMLWKSTDVFA